MTAKKITTSVKLPLKIEQELLSRVISDGYGMHGKSRWIEEAIKDFIKLPDYPEYVDIATEQSELKKTISLRVNENLDASLKEATIEIRKKFPLLEHVKSNLIRASIMQRLLRN